MPYSRDEHEIGAPRFALDYAWRLQKANSNQHNTIRLPDA